MTGNVAMVFTSDDDWAATISAVHARLRPGGRFVFETRVPEREAWLEWTADQTTSGSTYPAWVRSPTGSRCSTCGCRS